MRMSDWSSDVCSSDLNRINVSVQDYNAAVQDYNTTIRTFPDIIGAKIVHGAEPMTPYRAITPNANQAPKVDFGSYGGHSRPVSFAGRSGPFGAAAYSRARHDAELPHASGQPGRRSGHYHARRRGDRAQHTRK